MAVTQAVLPSFSNFCYTSENMKVCLFQICYLTKLGLFTVFFFTVIANVNVHFDSDFNLISSSIMTAD